MDKIKVSETFRSVQGEGRHCGAPSVFLRTFGCNFHCSGFGMPRGQLSTERDQVDPSNYERFEDLPLVTTGCDSYASWDPRFKKFGKTYTIEEIVQVMRDLLPDRKWGRNHLVITGGEPLLSWQRAYLTLLKHNDMLDLRYLTFETNGTKQLTPELREFLGDWAAHLKTTFSVSAKLPCSGHSFEEAIKPEVVLEYQTVGETFLKFVVATEQDVQDAEAATLIYQNAGFTGDIYLMPVGGVVEVYQLNARNVAEAALARGWKYSPRLHTDLWGNSWGT